MLKNLFKEKKGRAILCAVYGVLILLTLAFIFNNSLASKEESGEQSDKVVELVRPIIDPDGNMTDDEISTVVRKTAHFVEFGALGGELALLAFTLASGFRLSGCLHSLLASLLAANIDELIQIHSDRGSSVADVFIDLGGAVIGIAAGYLLAYAVRALRKRLSLRGAKNKTLT